MYYVTEHNAHPSCIINMDETAVKLLGLEHRRFIGSADKRNATISTVVTMTGTIMAQLIEAGATKRVLQDLPEHEKISCRFKQGFLHWVLLWECASP